MSDIQRKISLSYFNDGIWDIGLGFLAMLLGFFYTYREISIWLNVTLMIFSLAYLIAIVPIVKYVKMKVTFPRIGIIEPRYYVPKKKHIIVFVIVLSTFFITSILFVYLNNIFDYPFIVYPSFIFTVSVIYGIGLKVYRLIIHGLIACSSFVINIFLDDVISSMISLIFGSLIIIFIGIYYLVNFLLKNPKRSDLHEE